MKREKRQMQYGSGSRMSIRWPMAPSTATASLAERLDPSGMRTRSAVKSGAVPVRPRYVERSAFDMIGSRKPVKLAGGCPLDGGVRAHGVRRKPRFGVCPDRRALPLEVTACDDERKCSLHKWALTFDMSGRPLDATDPLRRRQEERRPRRSLRF